MLKLLLFFLFLELLILEFLFGLLLHLDILLVMLQNNLVHGVILDFLLQFGFVMENLFYFIGLILLFLEGTIVMRISLFVGLCNLFLDVIHLVLNILINNLHVFEVSTLRHTEILLDRNLLGFTVQLETHEFLLSLFHLQVKILQSILLGSL